MVDLITILIESELIALLGIKKSALNELRYKHRLPFCKVSHTKRIYLVKDVLDFIESKRVILNKDSEEEEGKCRQK
jgi:hypothetical protein